MRLYIHLYRHIQVCPIALFVIGLQKAVGVS